MLITQHRISAYVMVGDVFSPYELKFNLTFISQYTDRSSIINTNRVTLYRDSNAFHSDSIRDKFRLQLQSFLMLNMVGYTVPNMKFKV